MKTMSHVVNSLKNILLSFVVSTSTMSVYSYQIVASINILIVLLLSWIIRNRPGWFTHLADFGNMMKAFIGANFLSVAYAFRQSGLGLGLFGLVLIASLTDHCCLLIVKCKYHAIRKVLRDYSASTDINATEENDVDDENLPLVKRMENNLSYGDVGKLSFGKFGLSVVNFCIVLTQFGFCVSYFVFVGQTLKNLFPLRECRYNTSALIFSGNGSNHSILPLCHNTTENHIGDFHFNSTFQSYLDPSQLREEQISTFDVVSNGSFSQIWNEDSGGKADKNLHTLHKFDTSPEYHNQTGTKSESTAPDLKFLVLCPLPIFLLFAIIRRMRHLGVISVLADISLFIGCVSVFIYLILGFEVQKDFNWINIQGFPVFFGQVTGSFEGIGVILPIESSMEGSRGHFEWFLHGAIFILSCILCVMGTMGYLRFGSSVQQLINSNIPITSGIAYAVNICLIIAIMLTFPLQVFPVIELIEKALMSEGRICGPSKRTGKESVEENHSGSFCSESEQLISSTSDEEDETSTIGVAHVVPDVVPAWKRNVLRCLIVFIAAGLAIIFRDNFAYIGAFVGAIGSTMLAYILPCAFHITLAGNDIPLPIKIKDICIIIFGVVAGIISLYTVIDHLVHNTKL